MIEAVVESVIVAFILLMIFEEELVEIFKKRDDKPRKTNKRTVEKELEE